MSSKLKAIHVLYWIPTALLVFKLMADSMWWECRNQAGISSMLKYYRFTLSFFTGLQHWFSYIYMFTYVCV